MRHVNKFFKMSVLDLKRTKHSYSISFKFKERNVFSFCTRLDYRFSAPLKELRLLLLQLNVKTTYIKSTRHNLQSKLLLKGESEGKN